MLKGSFGGYMLKGSGVFLGTLKLLSITHANGVFLGGIYVLKGSKVFLGTC